MKSKPLKLEDVQRDVVLKSSVVMSFRTSYKYRDFIKKNDIDLKRLVEKTLDQLGSPKMKHNIIAESRIEPYLMKVMGSLTPREKMVMQLTIEQMEQK